MTQHPKIHIADRGAGPPMVFIHGWLNDHSVWDGVVARLEQSFRCLALDLRGHGASGAARPGQYGRALVLDDLRRLLDEHDLGPTVLVGHSLGGYLALALAIEDPERVAGLGLVAAGPGFRNPASLEQWNASVEQTAQGRDIPPGQQAISMHVDSMVMDHLSEIKAPAAVIVGERDKRFLASAAIFDKHLDVRLNVVVPGAGHMVHAKNPDATADALRRVFAPEGRSEAEG